MKNCYIFVKNLEDMKNIHVLPTDKPSELYINMQGILSKSNSLLLRLKSRHIYITNDEEIKEGDWIFDLDTKSIVKADSFKVITSKKSKCWYYKKIILTTDQDLIKDGVQAIDDEFLEWFVNNPSCDFAHLGFTSIIGDSETKRTYKIIIPKEEPTFENSIDNTMNIMSIANSMFGKKEEPKQETLEEAAERISKSHSVHETGQDDVYQGVIQGAKWQAERMYSEEEVVSFIHKFIKEHQPQLPYLIGGINMWFKQFKKK